MKHLGVLDKRWVRIFVLLVVGFVAFVAYPFVSSAAKYGDEGQEVKQVQQALVDGGWWTWVDGEYGPHTYRTVAAFQKANGLQVDGIAGPITQGALGLSQAVRGQQQQITKPVVAPNPPPGKIPGRCTEWEAGLAYFSPGWDVVRMSKIMYRESRCRPDVTSNTGCCRGLLQIHQIHIPNLAPCGVYSKQDLFTPGKNICSAAIVYKRAGGMSPWAL